VLSRTQLLVVDAKLLLEIVIGHDTAYR
jgi:hypothetical protein